MTTRSPAPRLAARGASALAALLLASALAPPVHAQGEEELPLESLPAGSAPAKPAKAKKPPPKKGKARAQRPAPATDAESQIDSSGAMIAMPPGAPPPPAKGPAAQTPAAPLPDIPLLGLSTRIAVALVRSPLVNEATAIDLESGLRGVAFQAPLSQNPTVLRPALDAPESAICHAGDDACFIAWGAREQTDSVVVASFEPGLQGGLSVTVRQLSVHEQKKVGEARAESPPERAALKAQTESLVCKLLVPAGCTNELQLDTSGAEILYDGRPLPRGTGVPMRAVLPVGLAPLSARVNGKTGPVRLVPVLREKMAGIAMTVRVQRDGTPLLLSPAEVDADDERPPAPAVATADAAGPATPRAGWIRPAGFGVAGAGGALLLAGLIEGAHSKSLLNGASSAYAANGGAYQPGDLAGLNDGNSAAHTANILILAGALVAAAGLTLALAF